MLELLDIISMIDLGDIMQELLDILVRLIEVI